MDVGVENIHNNDSNQDDTDCHNNADGVNKRYRKDHQTSNDGVTGELAVRQSR